jgi:tetratricopeptide (TPR) repeat protein
MKLITSLSENSHNIEKHISLSARPECFCKAKMYRRIKRKLIVINFIMKKILFILIIIPISVYPFSYDSAIYAAQKGDLQKAYSLLNSIIINNPDNAEVLYDTGIVAQRLGNTGQAKACFMRSAECAQDDNLRFNAYFKAGNVCVDDKDLPCALEQYDKALAIKPADEYVQHNRDRVAEMLQKQEQQEQKQEEQQKQEQEKEQEEQQEQDQQNQDSQDKQQQQQKQDQNNTDDQSGNDSSSAKASQEKQGQNKKEDSEDGSDQQSQGEKRNDAKSGDKDAQRKEHRNKKQGEKKPADNQDRNGDHELDKKSENAQKERENQQSNKHNKAPEKQNETNDKANVASQGVQEQDKNDDKQGMMKIEDPWLLNILNHQEEQDKSINKQLMEAKVRQHGGKNAQNFW